MTYPILTGIILIFIVWLHYEIRKTSRSSKKDTNNFWNKEKESNLVRRVDISGLNYLTLNTKLLPMEDHEDQTINSYRDTILKLTNKKMLNLAGLTNTELKYKYGAANINLLAEYDNNYTILVSMLQKWAERLNNGGFTDESLSVLEYALTFPTDVTKSYKLLADLYKKKNTPHKIDDLISIIMETAIQDKSKLIEELNKIKFS
jgi:hypothetical protein